jgi:hypothetical protein
MAHSAESSLHLMPADVVGTMIYNIKQNEFSIKRDLFLLVLLADD